MAGLDPAIHVLGALETWMAVSSTAMTAWFRGAGMTSQTLQWTSARRCC
jgi:hypothetical protein